MLLLQFRFHIYIDLNEKHLYLDIVRFIHTHDWLKQKAKLNEQSSITYMCI